MEIYFSKSTLGFYDSNIHDPVKIPADAVEITREEHAQLLAAQAAGKVIQADQDGKPVAIDYVPPQLSQHEQAMQTLRSLDLLLPRIAEDIIEAGGINETNLPQIVRDRLAAKRAARAIVNQNLEG